MYNIKLTSYFFSFYYFAFIISFYYNSSTRAKGIYQLTYKGRRILSWTNGELMSKRLRTTDLNISIYHYFAIKIIQNYILF